MSAKQLAKRNFATMLEYLQSENWKFTDESEEGYYRVLIRFKTDDFPLIHFFRIDEEDRAFVVRSHMEFDITPEEGKPLAAALMIVNETLQYGRFDFSLKHGRLLFFYAHYYGDNKITFDQYAHVIAAINYTVDRFNDKFYLLVKGRMTINQFYDFVQEEN